MTGTSGGHHMIATVDPAEPEADLALSGRSLQRLAPVIDSLRGATVEELVALTSSAAPVERRHGAGLVLGLVGDPRISTFDPPTVEVPGGVYEIGIDPEDVASVVARWGHLGVLAEWIEKEVPRHAVEVEPFRIGLHPVTNQEFLDYVLDAAPLERPSSWGHGTFPIGAANQPVYTVSPEQADAYCAWLSSRTGRSLRLPTEAEWEIAASGGDRRDFPWGDELDVDRANVAETGILTTTPVGIFPLGASAFGALDMAGNVEEYVADDYRPYPGATVVRDDLVETHGESYRIARGGSFARHGDLARRARRHGWYHSAHYAMGFRIAESDRP